MASSETRNSFARAVALTGRPHISRLSISFFLIAPDEPCINKNYHARSRNTIDPLFSGDLPPCGSESDLASEHLGDKLAVAEPTSSGESSGRKCARFTVTALWFGRARQNSRCAPIRKPSR